MHIKPHNVNPMPSMMFQTASGSGARGSGVRGSETCGSGPAHAPGCSAGL